MPDPRMDGGWEGGGGGLVLHAMAELSMMTIHGKPVIVLEQIISVLKWLNTCPKILDPIASPIIHKKRDMGNAQNI